LRTLHYKKKFHTWFSEIKPKITAVLEASKEVQRSKRLKKMLEIILAFGNYMNRFDKSCNERSAACCNIALLSCKVHRSYITSHGSLDTFVLYIVSFQTRIYQHLILLLNCPNFQRSTRQRRGLQAFKPNEDLGHEVELQQERHSPALHRRHLRTKGKEEEAHGII
jgi:hypothetical protein